METLEGQAKVLANPKHAIDGNNVEAYIPQNRLV
jgi:hypothetical protein